MADLEVFGLAGSEDRLKVVWDTVKTKLLRDWIKEHPCSRPFAFWLLADERRKKISGSGGWTCGMMIDAEGLPKYWQLEWNKNWPQNFESQAAFLKRNGLLSDTEKAYLEKHPGLLKPERIEFEED